ncbi:MAG TPA: nicotinate-nucleotide adenylyltransferase [Acidimicrobiales bacterium]|nr:nicotinate-nucleotide adenylyltransferase [Acidimicrobiales bacterium]
MSARIGVFGGTFDPPHVGHLIAACEVREVLGLDRVLLVVANRPWQKVGTRPITDASIRLAMVQAATEGLDGLEASDIEIRRDGDSYTADTLAELRGLAPTAEMFVILGADAAAVIDTWERADEVRAAATIVAYDRAGGISEDRYELDDDIRTIRVPRIDISSTDIRSRVAQGRRNDVLCPPGVIRIIERHGLYRVGDP